ncbi:T9SS type A sorting domain-containing protein [Spirosoma taeanense]|uniref:T9SS type A sorting domain-containing protein n=1 Tax=Spirosoma taeanense TaxID=2735870 RepID=A0A6M5YEF9_9BACT|nr:T9SS type A sorting domain-containing protein [Spirosoma taeanense]QJW91362.1 T9SS type A sorting domain-containing protein [Spirosoma taeanense]
MKQTIRFILCLLATLLFVPVMAQTGTGPSLTFANNVNKLQRSGTTYLPTSDGNLVVAFFYANGVGASVKDWNLQLTKYLPTGKVAYSPLPLATYPGISGNVVLAETADHSLIVSGNGVTYSFEIGNTAKLKWKTAARATVMYATADGGILLNDTDNNVATKLSAKGEKQWDLGAKNLIPTSDGGYVSYDGSGKLNKLDAQRQSTWQSPESAAFAQATKDGIVYRAATKLIKTDNAGAVKFSHTIAGDAGAVTRVVVAADGGLAYSTNQTVKLDAAGAVQWQSQVPGVVQQTLDGGFLTLQRDRPASEVNTTGYTMSKLTADGTTAWQRYISGQIDADLANQRGQAGAFQSQQGDYWFVTETNTGNAFTSNLIISRFCRDILPLRVVAGMASGARPIRKDTSFTVCRGDSLILGFTEENQIPGLLFQWKQNGSNVASTPKGIFRVKDPGTYVVEAADTACGVRATSPATTISQSPAPRVVLAGSNYFCAGSSAILTATASNGTGEYRYQWTRNGRPFSTSATVTVTEEGVYSVMAGDDGGCFSQPAVQNVTVNPVITVGITGSDYFCPGQSTRLSAAVTGGTPGFRYQWKRGGEALAARNVNFTADQIGTYSVEVVDSRNCAVESKTLVVTQNPSLTLSAGTNTTLTGTEVFSLAGVTTVKGGVGPYTYQWTTNPAEVAGNGSTAAQPTFGPFNKNTDILLTATDSKGCSLTALSTVTYKPCTIEAVISGQNYYCTGTATSLSLVITNGNGPYRTVWQGTEMLLNTNTYTQNYQSPATLTADVTDAKGCTVKAKSVVVTEATRPTATISGTTEFCKGSSTNLSAVIAGGKAPYTYDWRLDNKSVSTTGGTLNATTPGTYMVLVKDANGCDNPSANLVVTQRASDLDAKITPSGPTDVFLPASVTLTANAGTSLTYQWQKDGQDIAGATTTTFSTTQTGSYIVKVSKDGCTLASPAVAVSVQSPLAIEPIAAPVSFEVYPNPVESTCEVAVQVTKPSAVVVTVYDLMGRAVRTLGAPTKAKSHNLTLNLSLLPAGTYVIDVQAGEATARQRLMKVSGQ